MTQVSTEPTARTARSLTASDVIGTWLLMSIHIMIDGEVARSALGDEPRGQIMYGSDGRMSALLMRPDRPWPANGDFLVNATVDQRGDAALEFVGYGGTYEVLGDRVVHHVEISLYPEMVGTDLVRTAAWDGSQLVLETEHLTTPSGRVRWQRLTWRHEVYADRQRAAGSGD